ncbi:ATP-dependent DNA helicase RecG, partial [Patescibacteria group bacterium]
FAIKKIIKKLIESEEEFIDIVPKETLDLYHLPTLKDSLIYIHTPKNAKDAEAARKRFAFEEIFLIQLSRVQKRLAHEKCSSFDIKVDKKQLEGFVNSFPFRLTKTQERAIKHITNDLQKGSPMSRFLEGDVGSGKTVVAATSAFLVLKNGYQTAYMAPTEVLARQLFESFVSYFTKYGTKIGLITSSECRKFPSKVNPEISAKISKNRFIKYLRDGEIDIVIGTHSLIQDSITFSARDSKVYKEKKLALVIIDEQHRFGTNQRATLAGKRNETDKSIVPHFLTMSATPIPRTLALTVFGDLDLTLLDEMPKGRKKIITEIVSPEERNSAYTKIEEEINHGRQAYVICPRIEKPEEQTKKDTCPVRSRTQDAFAASNGMKAVKEEYEKLSKGVFSKYKLGMLYGKMPTKEKAKVMDDFQQGKIDILVTTSVIEVGVNVPNATTIIIEGAERFGLAQLHQLRGRVLRSTHQPYCFIFTESKTAKTKDRLQALKTAKNGFELAEYDLKFRGAGELSGKKQWGITDVGMEAIKNIKMVEAARTEAQRILADDPQLKNSPQLREKLLEENLNIHFE